MRLTQLHLRDLSWLVLVCALGLAWFVDRTLLGLEVGKSRRQIGNWMREVSKLQQVIDKVGLTPTNQSSDGDLRFKVPKHLQSEYGEIVESDLATETTQD